MNPKHPIYIVSKGRADRLPTCKSLDAMGVPFLIVVEPDERRAYESAVGSDRVLELDMSYKDVYETCDELGDSKPKGSGAARNFAWDHSIAQGASWHWCMDDNLLTFYRFQNNRRIRPADGTLLRTCEDFVERYENVGMAGPHYRMFVPSRQRRTTPFVLNTRIYSCNLIRNDVPFRWRGRYNEDTILSLDFLKGGWCTILFRHLLADKAATQTMKGGNTDTVYVDGTLPKSEMLVKIHPDVARLARRYGRWHHYVDYRAFARSPKLKRRKDYVPMNASNNYGMKLVDISDKL